MANMVRVRIWENGQSKVVMAEDFPLQDVDLGNLAPSALVFLLCEDLDEDTKAKIRHQLVCCVGENDADKMLLVAHDARNEFCKVIFKPINMDIV